MFNKQVVWITGASSGIGEALAYHFSKQGARLIISSRRENELERVKKNCGDNAEVFILQLDLSETGTHPDKVKEAVSVYGHIDILLNNGGISQRGLASETRLDVVRKVMEVNFFGTVSLTRELLPYMIKRQSGYIVVISSVMGKFGTRFRSTYAASKHALHGWFDCLRQELFSEHIDVTLVCPGYVKTDITYNLLLPDGSRLNEMGEGQRGGLSPDTFAAKLLPRLNRRQKEIYIGGKEIIAVYLKRFVPGLLDKILSRAKVT